MSTPIFTTELLLIGPDGKKDWFLTMGGKTPGPFPPELPIIESNKRIKKMKPITGDDRFKDINDLIEFFKTADLDLSVGRTRDFILIEAACEYLVNIGLCVHGSDNMQIPNGFVVVDRVARIDFE
jgi:hypothetical protein